MKETVLPEGVTRDQALYHIRRLQSSCNLLREIETGNMPMSSYSSGETEFKKNDKGQILVNKENHPVEIPVSLPIYGATTRDTHCLAFAVKSAIFSDYQLLSSWGGKEDAQAMINESRLCPKKAIVYETRRS